MPAMPNVPGVYKVEMRFTDDNQQVENVYHCHPESNNNPASLSQVSDLFVGWYESFLRSKQGELVSLVEIVTTDLTTPSSPQLIVGLAANNNGQDTGGALPNNVTVCISWHTALRGRSYRGRTFHVGLTEPHIEGSYLLAGEPEALAICYDQLRTTLAGNLVGLGVVSYRTNKTLRPEGIFTKYISVTVDNVTDSQRRRLPGRGR